MMHVLKYEEKGPLPKLDVKDKRILACLAANARMTQSAIAKEVLLSPEAVKHRIQRLRERKVLLGARTIISGAKLGYFSYHLFLSLHPPSLSHEAAYVKFFQQDRRVNAALQFLGKWDFELSVRVRTPQELDEFRLHLSEECPAIQDERIILLLENVKSTALPKGVFPDIALAPARNRHAESNALIDDADLRLLHAIADDADLRIEQIAQKANLTRDQVTYRMQKLQEQQVILGFVPVINYAMLGYSVHAVLFRFHGRNSARERALNEHMREDPAVLWAVRTLGEWDLLVYTISRSNSDFYEYMVRLREHFSDIIKNYETLIAYREYKYTYMPGRH